MRTRPAISLALILFAAQGVRGEQVVMQNGDRYTGSVVSMTAETVVLQNDVLGKIKIPRSKVASINLGTTPPTPVAAAPNQTNGPSISLAGTNSDISTALRHLGANTNFIEQVRRQFLADAGPDANGKYDELVSGLFSGKLDLNDLRKQAKAAAEQIRTLKRQGGDVGEPLDSYLAILDNFIRESAPTAQPAAMPSRTTNNNPSIIIGHQ